MKTPVTFLTTIACLLTISVQAQVTFGVKGSFVRSHLDMAADLTYVGYDDHSKALNGYGTAVSLYFQIFRHLHIGIEPGLIRRGSRTVNYLTMNHSAFHCWDYEANTFKDCEVEAYGENRTYTQYVQVPLLLKGLFPLCNDRLSVFVKAGGGFSWLSSAQHERGNNELFGIGFESSAINLQEVTHIKRWDRAWYTGAGFDFKLGAGYLSLESQLYHGTQDFYAFKKSHIRSIEYSLGYQVKL